MTSSLVLSFVLFFGVAVAAAERPVAVPVEGEPFEAELIGCDAAWRLAFHPERRLPAGELVRWGTCREASRGPLVVLADGSVLVGELLGADRETVRADSGPFGLVQIPTAAVAGVLFDWPAEQGARDRRLDRLLQAENRSDVVLLANGDQLTGSLQEVREDAIRLETESGPARIETRDAAAIVFQPALRRPNDRTGLRAWVGLTDGSLVLCSALTVKGRTARLIPSAVPQPGIGLGSATDAAWKTAGEEIVFLQPLGGRAEYLSDRRADAFRHVPYLDLVQPYRADRNVMGGRLRAGGRLYLKGLGVHSTAGLSYLLKESYEAFGAELTLDDVAGRGGSVRFRVHVDGRKQYESPIVRGSDPPVPIRVDLRGAKRLDLIVDFADRADQLDRADWLDARLIRPREK